MAKRIDQLGIRMGNTSSPDAVAIARKVRALESAERHLKKTAQRRPDIAEYTQAMEDFSFLASISGSSRAPLARAKRRAYKILLRRFGNLATRQLLRAREAIGDCPLRLIIRPRERREFTTEAQKRHCKTERQIENARYLEEIMSHLRLGATQEEAIGRSNKTFGRILGSAGAERRLAEARRLAKDQGFVNPLAPMEQFYIGANRLELLVEELRGPGRPRKKPEN